MDGPERVVWEVAGKPVAVRLHPEMVGRLTIAVREGFKALPRRGLETGGILLGTRHEAGRQTVVEIDDFEAVECEHAAGPSYLLSDLDRTRLEATIAAHRGGGKTSVVGFYRSHTRSGFAITLEDQYVYDSYFGKASDVFLLIKSNDGGPPTGGFLIREGGKIRSATPYAEFPLLLNLSAPPASAAAVAVLPASDPIPVPAPTPRRRWNVRVPVWAAGAGAAAFSVGLAFGVWAHVPRAALAPGDSPLDLSVSDTGHGLRLSWNRRRPGADHARLHIQDGKSERTIELDAAQLREGSLVYWPSTNDVNFRMQWLAPGVTAAESVRAIRGAPEPVREASLFTAITADAPLPIASAPPPLLPLMKRPMIKRRLRAYVPPEPTVRLARPAPASVPEPPAVENPGQRILSLISGQVGRPVLPDAAGETQVRVTVEPVAGSRLEHVAQRIPLLGKRYRRSEYVAPVPLRDPVVTPGLSRGVTHEVQIDIKVYVNASGKVEYAEPASRVPESDRDLAALAMFSARRCEFIPAHTPAGAVAGEAILRYQFGARTTTARN